MVSIMMLASTPRVEFSSWSDTSGCSMLCTAFQMQRLVSRDMVSVSSPLAASVSRWISNWLSSLMQSLGPVCPWFGWDARLMISSSVAGFPRQASSWADRSSVRRIFAGVPASFPVVGSRRASAVGLAVATGADAWSRVAGLSGCPAWPGPRWRSRR